MPSNQNPGPIRIGLASDEPIRLAGLASIFEQPAQAGKPGLLPVPGTMDELLANASLEYLVVDLHSYSNGLETLAAIRKVRPGLRLIVIGPGNDDELVLESIVAGARAFLDLTAGPETVRKAIEVVTEGSIWAPRRLLSRLIDRLLHSSVSSASDSASRLTAREHQVLELILTARSNREIASELGIEERTVKAHVTRLMRKTGCDSRVKLSVSAAKLTLSSGRSEPSLQTRSGFAAEVSKK
ncbi:MAG: LuxR C-terminal-related transcriptional regulator [Acidobacteriota bacterium]